MRSTQFPRQHDMHRCIVLCSFVDRRHVQHRPRAAADHRGGDQHCSVCGHGGFYFAVGADFFKRYYPQGLSDTIVVIDACETVGAGDSDLALAIVGDSSVYVGWNAPVQSTLVEGGV